MHGALGNSVPRPVPLSIETMRRLHQAMRAGLVVACHDCSEGGLGVAIAEMALAGELGADLDLRTAPRSPDLDEDASLLFSESSGRFVVEVRPEKQRAFEELMTGLPWGCLGKTTVEGILRIRGLRGQQIVWVRVEELKSAWRGS